MSDAMSNAELLSPGNQPALGASHAENVGFGEARDLGPGEVEKMFGPATTPLERLRAAGMVDKSEAEMGGGGDVDPVEDHFKKVGSDKIQAFIAEQQGKNYPDTSSVKLPDGTSISFGEYKKISVAIQNAQAQSDRRPIEEIVCEARRPTLPPPEPQPAPRPVDWRGGLPPDQQKWLADLQRNFGVDKNGALLALQNMIKEVDSNPRQLSRGLLPWGGSRNELRVILLRLGEEVQHQLAMENVLKLSLDRQQNTGEQIATKFLVELKQVLVKQFPNDLEKQNESVINLYERLRRDDALGFSPDIGLIPRGADIGILMRILKSMLGRNGG